MARRFRTRSLAASGWLRPRVEERIRRHPSSARITVQMERAALKLMRDIVKRRARAMLAEPGQLEMIAPGLSQMPPGPMVARLEALSRAARSLRQKGDPLAGRIDAHNLNAALLLARWRRRADLRLSLTREAA
ncbi:MAG: hypothetical protein JO196_10005 [Hyphomicrobiales bacterium]|nr:hypothetical protein [Hyphomicrobiales bacterium]